MRIGTVSGAEEYDRDGLIRLVDRLPEAEIHAAARYLEFLSKQGDAFARHLADAIEESDELGPEGQRLLEEGLADVVAGRVLGLDEVKRELDL